jgi:uncharacterized membrane protein
MKNINIKFALALGLLLLPIISQAQVYLSNTAGILRTATEIVDRILIPLVFALALLYFFWGVVKYIRSEGQGKEDGRMIMVWGVVALFVISSVWGLVFFLRRELNVTDTFNIRIPMISS